MERKIIKKIILAWVFFPVVSVIVFFSYCLCWTFYLLYAQTDAPQSQPKVPLNPVRVYKVTSYLLICIYENLTGPFIPSILQYGWHKLSSEGKKKPSVRKNIRYGPKPRNRLDVYHPNHVSSKNKRYNDHMGHSAPNSSQQQTDIPVIIFIGTSWNSGNKDTCMPVAHNLQSQGYIVIVPDITIYPIGKIADMVEDIQRCIFWTHTHIRSFRGDPSQIYLMGHGAGSLLSALTIIHDVCATLNVLPPNNTSIKIPLWDNNIRRTELPRVHGLILFSGVYDITYYYAYLYKKGLEQVHALPRVMGNKPDAFLQCSPSYLLNHALNNIHNREQLKMLLPRKVVLFHGDQQDTFNPVTTTHNFCSLLESAGIPSVKLNIYDHIKHISPKIDLIVPTRPLCINLLKDIKECCKGQGVMIGGQLKDEKEMTNKDKTKIRSSRRRMSQVRHE
ncbi:Alpha/Beta hydrolase protein [Glomus cerebriforme]|uniref:Alpha/Beta hydrolase protein n=1 Tax=Glomus cerebriforme TaxID=658196 RepID=A0A397TKN6_9GLOM|nr:Alpha/Beta hydrolase protein [Glomus cerebriforme]